MNQKVFCGNNVELLKQYPDNYFDSVVTDPPYGLGKEPDSAEMLKAWVESGYMEVKGSGFMGKEWDAFVPQPIFWKEVFRVLKHGGHVVAFYGTRTYDWGVMAMRLAGFEVRDCLFWCYGCLSEDTEILTRSGYIQYHKFKRLPNFEQQEILIYDVEKDIYKWEKPERWNEYNINKDTCYRIKSDNTDQIVSRNHNCLVEREGELVFIKAEELSEMEFMPTLSNDFLDIQKSKVLQSSMQRILSGSGLEETRTQGKKIMVGGNQREVSFISNGREQSIMERRNNLPNEEGVLFGSQVEICEMPKGVYSNGEERRICSGIPINNGYAVGQTSFENGVRTPYRPQSNEQRHNELDVICNEQGTQAIRVGKSYSTTLATITPIEYSGIIFCPTVSTGCFVARRKGKIFITGNSGFPKSHNISKAIDKMKGAEREVVGKGKEGMKSITSERVNQGYRKNLTIANEIDSYDITAPATEEAKQWDGWGSALKPAVEPIVLARKPLEKGLSIAENVLKWGVGGINIDGCRISSNELITNHSRGSESAISKGKYGDSKEQETHQTNGQQLGRFPANLLLSHSNYQVMNLVGNIDSHTLAEIIRYFYGYTKVCDLRERKRGSTKQDKCRNEVLQPRVQQNFTKEEFDTQQNTSELSELPNSICDNEGSLSERKEEILQPTMQRPTSETYEGGDSNKIREKAHTGIQEKNGGNENKEWNDFVKGKAPELEGWKDESSRICEHNDFNTTDGMAGNGKEDATQTNLHFGTQNSDGNGIEKTSFAFGECSSHKRDKERQQTEQFSNRGQSESLKNTSENRCRDGSIKERKPILEVLDFDIPTEWLRYFEYTGEQLGCECKGLKKVGSGKEGGYNYEGNVYEVEGFVPNNSPKANSNYGEETIEDWDCHEDCPIRIMDEQSGESKSIRSERGNIVNNNVFGKYNEQENTLRGHNDKGGASRFFYCAKASKSERNKGLEGFEEKRPDERDSKGMGTFEEKGVAKQSNFHPTVKPVKLMQYLVRLITPPNGIVLDPFCGSGTTGIACKLEDFNFIGLELDAEYHKIAEARINNYVEEPEEIKNNNDNINKSGTQIQLF